jgi:DnaJ-class molecular chaperone
VQKRRGKRGRVENLKPWKPGQSGNPGGRPRNILGEAYEEILVRVVPNDSKKRTYAQRIAEGQIKAAVKGNTAAAREIADRTEGKPRQRLDIAHEDDGPLMFNLNVKFTEPKTIACETCGGSGRSSSGLEDCASCGGTRTRD